MNYLLLLESQVQSGWGKLYSTGREAVEPLRTLFPTSIIDDAVNRKALMEVIMQNASAIKDIELVVHPLVIAKREQFTLEAKQNGEFMIFYDVPLLFENRKNYEIDYVIVVSADPETQRRVIQTNKRDGNKLHKNGTIVTKTIDFQI
jgi:dephospho-CoA kinase